ncbi:hypothetical protein QTP70_019876 [Hemibagrus guttatus]|uniref:Uncharacterized protein n=1 Tax=Hemibagrus guttatus TaxID=175788 RepID=A0AAE0QA33_9TELE|nr:hypothetical protein QTP70_019876 [Hemibagrus guttatus]
MKRNQWRKGAWESASGSVGAMSPSHNTSFALALLLISVIPPCTGAPLFQDLSTTENDKLLNQTLDTLWDLCDWMQGALTKAQREPEFCMAFSTVFHPLLQLIPQLRRRRRVVSHPRNGRRSSEYV